MKIKFDFSDETFEVEAEEPHGVVELLEIPQPPKLKKIPGKVLPRFVPTDPMKVYGRSTLDDTVLKFNRQVIESSANNLSEVIGQQVES